MDYCILFRNTANGVVGFVSDDNENIAVFPDETTAMEATRRVPVCRAFPFQIVPLEDLPAPREEYPDHGGTDPWNTSGPLSR